MWSPVVEELVFRAGIQKFLSQQKLAPLLANCTTSLVFALTHFTISGNPAMLMVIAPSLLLGWTYQKTSSLVWTMVLHSVLNWVFLAGMCSL
jgi:uncharacterized protein